MSSVDFKDLQRLTKWIANLDKIIDNPRVLGPSVRRIGYHIERNFAGEGSYLPRRWQALADMTNQVRRERGYPEAHPILVQSGALRTAAVAPLKGFTGLTALAAGKGVVTLAVARRRQFTAVINGEKVQNQFGGFNVENEREYGYFAAMNDTGRAGRFYVPPRPFWFLTAQMMDDAERALMKKIESDWGRGTKR